MTTPTGLTSEDVEREQRIAKARKDMEAAFAAGDKEAAHMHCATFNAELRARSPAAQLMLRRFLCGGAE